MGVGKSRTTAGPYLSYAHAFLAHSGGEISIEARDSFLPFLVGRYGPRTVANIRASLNQFSRLMLKLGY